VLDYAVVVFVRFVAGRLAMAASRTVKAKAFDVTSIIARPRGGVHTDRQPRPRYRLIALGGTNPARRGSSLALGTGRPRGHPASSAKPGVERKAETDDPAGPAATAGPMSQARTIR
jgi:hypothetical protein